MVMTSPKFYAVKRGRIVGVYRSWEECLKQVKGYPHPVYRRFTNIVDAINFLDWTESQKMAFANSGKKHVYRSAVVDTQDLNRAVQSIKDFANQMKNPA